MFSAMLLIMAVWALGAMAAMVDVKVGDGGLTFSPDSVTASEADTVMFHFYSGSGSHSVVSSTFDSPCVPNTNAFYSGIVQGDSNGDRTFTINITSTDPIWFYCSVGQHCQSGMVGVINPPQSSDETLPNFASAAKDVLRSSQPGTIQGGVLVTGAATTPTPRPSISASSSSSTAASSSTSSSTPTTGSTTSSASSTGGSTGSSTSSSGSTGSGNAASTTSAGSTTPASTSPSVAATTTPSGAGRMNEWSVVMALGVIMGGMVAMMA